MKLSVRSDVSYTNPGGPCTFVFNVEAAFIPSQNVESESLKVAPAGEADRYQSGDLGNRYARIHLPDAGKVAVTYEAEVAVEHVTGDAASISEIAPDQLPLSILPYTYPSRYCQSDRLLRMAGREFGSLDPGFFRVIAICDWITDRVEYLSGSTDAHTSAFDTATELTGVCRDFAHLGIAFCRALNIPARFVSVYALDLHPPDFHAIFEAYLGGRWWLFDPTRLVPLDAVVRIGTGRDAADVSFATIWGPAEFSSQNVSVTRLDGEGSDWDGSPVALA